jgi:hypothetical protein
VLTPEEVIKPQGTLALDAAIVYRWFITKRLAGRARVRPADSRAHVDLAAEPIPDSRAGLNRALGCLSQAREQEESHALTRFQ